VPKPRSLSSSLPEGLRIDRKGGPILALRHVSGLGEGAVVRPRSTGTRDVRKATRIRDEWLVVIEAARRNQPTVAGTTPLRAVEDFIRFKRSGDLTEQHVDQWERYILEFLDRSGIRGLADLTPELVSVTLEEIRTSPTPKAKPGGRSETRKANARKRAERAAAATARAAGKPVPKPEPDEPFTLSTTTLNARIVAIRSFAKWLTERGVFGRDPLIGLKKRKPGEPRRPKGALLFGEAMRLIEGSVGLPVRHGMTGAERQAIYAAAIGTGLRLSALKATRVRHWHLDVDPPFVELVHAKDAKKRGRKKVVADFVVPILTARFAEMGEQEPAMPKALNQFVAARMVRRDLVDLGMPTDDPNGRRGFHSLRGTVASILAEHVAEAMLAATLDHTDPKTTRRHYEKNQLREMARVTNEGWRQARIQSGFVTSPNDTQRDPNATDAAPTPIPSPEPNGRETGDLHPNDTPMLEAIPKPPNGIEPSTSRLQIRCSAN
jgi:integrase